MAHIFNFAILEAVPDARRGERVNVGIIIFLPDRVDIRLSEVAKVRALKEGSWDDYLGDVRSRLIATFVIGESPAEFMQRAALIDRVVRFSDLSWFSIDHPDQFEGRVRSILTALVTRAKGVVREKVTRINAEIARTFKASKVLATPKDSLMEDRKVFRNYTISEEEELTADFIVKNGLFHVTVTLDLRRASVPVGNAALKAITLDKSSNALAGGVRKIAVYAAPPGAQQFRAHIGILTDYADHVFNWLDPDQRILYTRSTYDAISGSAGYQLVHH
jgi:hypothetical protein